MAVVGGRPPEPTPAVAPDPATADPVGDGGIADPVGEGGAADPVGDGQAADPVGGGGAADPTGAGGIPTLAGAVGTVLALIGFLLGAEAITDNSLLTHLATGELILDEGRVPTVDPYSASAPGGAWTVQSWLASVVYAFGERAVGPWFLRLVHGLAGLAVMAGMWRLTGPARQLVPRAGLAVVPIALGAGFWSPRPLMFGLVGMVVVLLAVQGMVRPWVLVPTMWLWVNSHGSFPLAFVLLGAVVVGELIDRRRLPAEELRTAGWAVAGLLLAGLNPIGPRILWFPLHLLGRREALEEVVEWGAPTFQDPGQLLYLGLLGLVVVAATLGAPWRSLLPAVGFYATGFLAIRNINVAVLVVVAMLAPVFRDRFGAIDGRAAGRPARLVAVAALAGVAVSMAALPRSPALVLDAYPVAEIDELERRGLVATGDVTLIHREAVGNYLGYRYGRDADVFIDDRFDYFPLPVTEDHLTLLDGGDYRDVLDRRGADVVLWGSDGLLADWLAEAPGWDLIHTGEDWIIACRLDGPVADRCR